MRFLELLLAGAIAGASAVFMASPAAAAANHAAAANRSAANRSAASRAAVATHAAGTSPKAVPVAAASPARNTATPPAASPAPGHVNASLPGAGGDTAGQRVEGAAWRIPAAAGALDVIRRHYTSRDLPAWVPPHVRRATILTYQMPGSTTFDDLTAFYARSLGQQEWIPTKTTDVGPERYLFYRKGPEQIILHLRPQDKLLAVDGLGLSFTDDAPLSEDNFGPSTAAAPLSQKIEAIRKGTTVHVICPAGSVSIRAHQGRDIRFDVMAHAAVDYPRVAGPVLKTVQILAQTDADGVTLGMSVPAGTDSAVRLGYTFTLSVPVGTDVTVNVEHSADPSVGVPDGRVEVFGAVGNVDIHTAGPVQVSDATGRVLVDTSSDPVLLRNLQGDITAHTTGMWIKAYAITLAGNVDLETTDGQVEAELTGVRDGALRCVTTNSPIRVTVPQDASVDLTVRGGTCNLPPLAEPLQVLAARPGSDAQGALPNARALHGAWNGGRIPFELVTSGGSTVYIQKK